MTANYVYNTLGERVTATAGGISTHTLYDETGRWIGDYDNAGTPLQQAVWLNDLPVGLLAGAGTGQVLHYVEPDHLSTPRAVIDRTREVAIWTWDAKSEAFGNSPPNQDPDLDGSAFVFNMRFPGQRYDAATGLNYNYFRDYDPASGRYVQSDPIGLRGGISTYVYVGGSPIMAVDTLRLETCLLTTVGPAGVRDHAAVYTSRGDGSGGPELYDPAGSYGAANGGGSGGLVIGEAADIKKFIEHHKGQRLSQPVRTPLARKRKTSSSKLPTFPQQSPSSAQKCLRRH